MAPRAGGRPRPRYWRSIEERRGARAGAAAPARVSRGGVGDDRRRQPAQLHAAAGRLGGAGQRWAPPACKPNEKIIPFVRRPEELTPGNPLHFATGYALEGFATGLLVESHEGRPTKIEGNPEHPGSLGASTALDQGLILGLYDDDRARQLSRKGQPIAWRAFLAEIAGVAARLAANGGRGAALPGRADGVAGGRRSAAAHPGAVPQGQVRQLLVGRRRRRRAGARAQLRAPAGGAPRPRGRRGDPVARRRLPRPTGPSSCAWRAASRRAASRAPNMNRLYVVEPALTVTGGDGRPPPAPARVRGGALRGGAGARAVRPARLRDPGAAGRPRSRPAPAPSPGTRAGCPRWRATSRRTAARAW